MLGKHRNCDPGRGFESHLSCSLSERSPNADLFGLGNETIVTAPFGRWAEGGGDFSGSGVYTILYVQNFPTVCD